MPRRRNCAPRYVSLCCEPNQATNNVYDYGVNKDVENLPRLRNRMSEIIDNYHNVQQDILETFIDRGQLRKLAEPTILPSGKRVPGLKLDHPRQLAVMHALVRFANVAAGGRFTTADLYAPALDALGLTEAKYSLASFRYDLSKLRAKGPGREGSAIPSLSTGRRPGPRGRMHSVRRIHDLPGHGIHAHSDPVYPARTRKPGISPSRQGPPRSPRWKRRRDCAILTLWRMV